MPIVLLAKRYLYIIVNVIYVVEEGFRFISLRRWTGDQIAPVMTANA